MNTQALDALAALCGAATSVPTAAPASSAVKDNNASLYALIARQLQENQASAAAAANQQAQQSASQQATLSRATLDALQAYLVSAGRGSQQQQQASGNAYPRAISLDRGVGFVPGPTGAGQLAAAAGLTRPNQPDLIAEAQAIAAKILMAQQLQQSQLQQSQLQQSQLQQPQLPQPQLPQPQLPRPQLPQQAFPNIPINKTPPAPALATNQVVHAPAAAMQSYPHAASSTSLPQHNALVEVYPAQEPQDKSSKQQSSVPSAKRPPPKKRHVRPATTGRVGGGLGDPALKSVLSEWEDKKQAKRAANRLSAHLSRKRKKMLIEDLKEENLELRRKEQILQSIPDLIIVFDSSGRMPFASPSVSRFLYYTSQELENASFWDLLTNDSTQSIKSAFMDVLAVKRHPDQDSTPLCDGDSMTIELLDKNESGKLVSLKGVVHFAGESPECVCSIRPEGDGGRRVDLYSSRKTKAAFSPNTTIFSSLSEVSVGSSAVGNRRRTPSNDVAAALATNTHRISDVDSVEKER